ncbi:hypothetical protein [Limnoglobus roseus]|uniref:DUF3341 domain-containing protein n=1 Tax=Limnoglobus roseus TaxID=2598579 RepID=A0A5C1ATA5_9BACT|nr:hypothetical protein [Limnoglobus roseus]QEL20832.1 hypothetical protein PX52LOC_07952 [Limnoglobus roseus]
MLQNRLNRKMVSVVFRDHDASEEAFAFLYDCGYNDNEINVLMSDEHHADALVRRDPHRYHAGTYATEGMGVGGAIGTAIGASIMAVVTLGSVTIPGLGFLIAGPIVAALAGGGAGAVTGGLVGRLIGAGMTEQNAHAYDAALREGGVAIGVYPHNCAEAEKIRERFAALGGENVCYC